MRTYPEVNEAHVLLVAAGVTFYALLALVPFLTRSVLIYGVFADPTTLDRHIDLLQGVVSSRGPRIVREHFQRLTAKGLAKPGLTSIAALIIALWTANSGMKAMFEAINVAYHEDEKRSFLWLTVITLVFTVVTIVAILAVVALVGVVPLVLEILGLGASSQWSARIAGVLLFFALMVSGLAALYRWDLGARRVGAGLPLALQWRSSWFWITWSLFGWYLAEYASYDATYGSLWGRSSVS